nr:hypothetical protein [Acidobacteriota bacterium]
VQTLSLGGEVRLLRVCQIQRAVGRRVTSVVHSAGLTVKTDQGCALEGFDGTVSIAPIVQAEITFCGKSFRGPYPLIEQEYGILGRNVLNFLALLFDGPNLNWDEYHRP